MPNTSSKAKSLPQVALEYVGQHLYSWRHSSTSWSADLAFPLIGRLGVPGPSRRRGVSPSCHGQALGHLHLASSSHWTASSFLAIRPVRCSGQLGDCLNLAFSQSGHLPRRGRSYSILGVSSDHLRDPPIQEAGLWVTQSLVQPKMWAALDDLCPMDEVATTIGQIHRQ